MFSILLNDGDLESDKVAPQGEEFIQELYKRVCKDLCIKEEINDEQRLDWLEKEGYLIFKPSINCRTNTKLREFIDKQLKQE